MAISFAWIVAGPFVHLRVDRDAVRNLQSAMEIKSLVSLVERYRADCGEYPSRREGFQALVVNPGLAGWHGPNLNAVPVDPWGQAFAYLPSDGSVPPEIVSYGADRKPGGTLFAADISSRNLPQRFVESRSDVSARRFLLASWIGAWVLLIAPGWALMWTYQSG